MTVHYVMGYCSYLSCGGMTFVIHDIHYYRRKTAAKKRGYRFHEQMVSR